MKKAILILGILVILISLIACRQTDTPANESIPSKTETYSFFATVLDVSDHSLLVQPSEDSNERKSSDKISLSFEGKTESIPAVGDTVKIFYDGTIAESYPAQIFQVYRIEIVNPESAENQG